MPGGLPVVKWRRGSDVFNDDGLPCSIYLKDMYVPVSESIIGANSEN